MCIRKVLLSTLLHIEFYYRSHSNTNTMMSIDNINVEKCYRVVASGGLLTGMTLMQKQKHSHKVSLRWDSEP